jgi:3-oxoacyl-[acyl-carrier protein] reductase
MTEATNINHATAISLPGQVAIVTGAGAGIGAAIAQQLARMGALTFVCGRRRAPLEATAATIIKAGGRPEVAECDVTDLSSVEALAALVERKAGRADILVNNAGVGSFAGPLHQMSLQSWEQVMNTNLRGVFYCIRSFAPMMIRASAGHIVNISSLAGKNALPNGAAYAASKWGLNGLTYSVGGTSQPQHPCVRGVPRIGEHRSQPARR